MSTSLGMGTSIIRVDLVGDDVDNGDRHEAGKNSGLQSGKMS
jgi:hypothetical protein